jgi:drug/metabolite transporter (DMT)-like permease
MSTPSRQKNHGIRAALASAAFLGMTPVFGKQAILMGFPPLGVVALRTLMAAALLLLVIFVVNRRYFYIYPAGLVGCLLAGGINGTGSLLYYASLGRIDAGLGQLLYATYPLFVALWLHLDREPLGRLTILRMLLVIPAIFLLTQTGNHHIDPVGMGMMLGAAALYALHLPINQRVLYEMPAPTVTFFTLLAMSLVVVPAYFLSTFFSPASAIPNNASSSAWSAVFALTLVTFLSRITLFVGVKHLGGMQTAILGLGELLVTLVFAHLLLGEHFSPMQWIGMVLLVVALLMVRMEKGPNHRASAGGWLSWLRPPNIPKDLPWQPHD